MVTLPGHLNRNAKPQYDLGPAKASFQLNHVTLLTLPTPSQREALRDLIAEQQNPKSPNYRKWLTPAEYAERFGLSQNDVAKISAWLKSQGLTVVSVANARNWIVFTGTSAQIEGAFHTQIHRYNVNGEMHFGPATMPSIPAALSGIAAGLRGADDFLPKPMYVRKAAVHAKGARPNYYDSTSSTDYLSPADIATIYDLNTLYTGGYKGTGQNLVIAGQTDVYLADLNAFRAGFGLPTISCTPDGSGLITTACNTSNFEYILNGTDPGVSENDLIEADLDLEYSAATAPGAKIIFVNTAASTTTNGGGVFDSFYYAIDNDLGKVISMSYGSCEFDDNTLPADEAELVKANSFGITFMNSSGDSGAASCDPPPSGTDPNNLATGGLAVSFPASSPEVTGVGGTAITYPGGFSSTYWGTNDGANNGGTAQNPPLPETSWNDDIELGALGQGSQLTVQENYGIIASGGGASNCSVQIDSFSDCGSGFPQPSWQTVTVPGQTGSVRLVPDVALLASVYFPGYVICTPLEELSNTAPYDTETTSSCGTGTTADILAAVNGIPVGDPTTVGPSVVGGTSASSPIFAGIVAILNQYLGTNGLANINPTLYTLALTTSTGSFHQITSGNNTVYCQVGEPVAPWPTALQCPATGSFGYDASNFDPPTGYNVVTGLGSVDVNNLAIAWKASESLTPTTTAVSTPSTSVSQGTSVTFTATVSPSGATGTVNFYSNGVATPLGSGAVSGGVATFTTTALPAGTNIVSATYAGDTSDNASSSLSPAQVNVAPPDFTLTATALTPASISAGQSASATLTIAPAGGVTGAGTVNFTPSSCSGLPAGATCSFSGTGSVTFGGASGSPTITVTIATTPNMAIPSGVQTITITGTESGVGGNTHSVPVTLTITATTESFTLTTTSGASTFIVSAVGGNAQVPLTVIGTNGFIVGTGAGATTALPLSYTCTGSSATVSSLPAAEITCALAPGSISQPTNSPTPTITLSTTAPTSQLRSPLGRSRFFYALLLPGLFGIVFAAGSRTRGLRLLGLIVVLCFSTMWLGSCSSGSTNTTITNPGTPTGTYTITVSATTGGTNPVTNSNAPFTFTLVVN
jgi:hypothetical protein